MLDISFTELARGAKENLFTNQSRFGVHESHYIL